MVELCHQWGESLRTTLQRGCKTIIVAQGNLFWRGGQSSHWVIETLGPMGGGGQQVQPELWNCSLPPTIATQPTHPHPPLHHPLPLLHCQTPPSLPHFPHSHRHSIRPKQRFDTSLETDTNLSQSTRKPVYQNVSLIRKQLINILEIFSVYSPYISVNSFIFNAYCKHTKRQDEVVKSLKQQVFRPNP